MDLCFGKPKTKVSLYDNVFYGKQHIHVGCLALRQFS